MNQKKKNQEVSVDGNQFCDLTSGIGEPLFSPKKRKIDKDGFLCPATPDTPITSSQYGVTKIPRSYDKEYDLGYQECSDEDNIQEEGNGDRNVMYDHESLPTNEVDHNTELGVTMLKDTSGMNFTEIMEDIGHQSKMLHKQWGESFRESENFESLCPGRLDKLIEQAKILEESLIKQKDLLCTRLNVISHIIRTSIMEGPGGDNLPNIVE